MIVAVPGETSKKSETKVGVKVESLGERLLREEAASQTA